MIVRVPALAAAERSRLGQIYLQWSQLPLLTLPGQEMAELTVNGQPAGVSFWPPHKFPLAGLLTPGKNTLTLTLTGSPANRYGKHPVPYGLET